MIDNGKRGRGCNKIISFLTAPGAQVGLFFFAAHIISLQIPDKKKHSKKPRTFRIKSF